MYIFTQIFHSNCWRQYFLSKNWYFWPIFGTTFIAPVAFAKKKKKPGAYEKKHKVVMILFYDPLLLQVEH